MERPIIVGNSCVPSQNRKSNFIDRRSVENNSHDYRHGQAQDTNSEHIQSCLHHGVILESLPHLSVLHTGVAGHHQVGENQPAGEGNHQVEAPVRQVLGLKQQFSQIKTEQNTPFI